MTDRVLTPPCPSAGPTRPRRAPGWCRVPLLSAVPLVALVAVGGLLPARVPVRQTRAQATRICAQARAAFAALPAPATLAAAQSGITSWLGGKYSDRLDSTTFSPLPAEVSNLESSLGDVSHALSESDGPGATHAVGEARRDLGAIDAAAKKVQLPGCSSRSFGRAYLTQVQSLVASTLALTGDFTTDANAACRRFDTKAVQIQKALNPRKIASVQAYLEALEVEYRALQIDLAAVTPPAGSANQFATFQASIRQAISELSSAGSALRSGDQTQLGQLGRQLSALGGTVNQEAAGLGLTC
jgi:hypothetical protein